MYIINGEFSVKTVYAILVRRNYDGLFFEGETIKLWKKIWVSEVLLKWKLFLWKVFVNVLLIKGNFVKRGCIIDFICNLCY